MEQPPEAMQLMDVQVPSGVPVGGQFMVNTPAGQQLPVQAVVPEGQMMQVQVPASLLQQNGYAQQQQYGGHAQQEQQYGGYGQQEPWRESGPPNEYEDPNMPNPTFDTVLSSIFGSMFTESLSGILNGLPVLALVLLVVSVLDTAIH